MLTKLLFLAALATALTACVADVPDEPSPTNTPALSQSVAGVEASGQAARVTATPADSSVGTLTPLPQPTPAREPQTVEPPAGSTGIAETGTGDMDYDQACFDAANQSDGEASPPAAKLDPPALADVAPFPGPYDAIPFAEDDTLQTRLDAILGDEAGDYAFYVKDLATGDGASHNGAQVFNAASLFKLFVMYEVFHQEQLGLVSWDDELVVTPYYDSFALSPRVTELCERITVGDAMDAMLSVSDNAAAVLLQDLAGSTNINQAIQTLGLKDSGLFEDGLPVTADDLALLMEAIATGNAISPEASADMLKLLDHDVFENGLVSGLPQGTSVSRKTGNWSDATNVAGIVYAPTGPYIFVALTTHGYETDVIQALSQATYDYFTTSRAQTAP